MTTPSAEVARLAAKIAATQFIHWKAEKERRRCEALQRALKRAPAAPCPRKRSWYERLWDWFG